MPLTFLCHTCTKRFFFQQFQIHNNQKTCETCYQKIQQEIKELNRAQAHQNKLRKRLEKRAQLNEKLRQEINTPKTSTSKQTSKKPSLQEAKAPSQEKKQDPSHQKIIKTTFSLEKKTSQLATQKNQVLFIQADIKRIKVIEWVNGKKRVALNKEREIRHTHKGGWSQEKFQRFVDTQKKQAPQWIKDNLQRSGVLRGPYDIIQIETIDANLQKAIEKITSRYQL